jgi:hypothetical protein
LALACAAGCNGGDDEQAPASCDGCACEDYCVEACQYAEAECGLGDSLSDCTRGCFDLEPAGCETAPVEGRRCEYFEFEISCYESAGSGDGFCSARGTTPPGVCDPDAASSNCRDTDVCNPATRLCELCGQDNCDGYCSNGACVECLETTHCGATQECVDAVCRERCGDSVPCATGRTCTFDDVCSDPIGKACDPKAFDFETCYGGQCVDENASLETVEPYCTLSCSTFQSTCPGNYLCQDGKCLER